MNKTGDNKKLYQANINMALREMGCSYVGRGGTLRPGRSVKDACSDKCPFECTMNFCKADRLQLHAHYWSLKRNERAPFLLGLIKRIYVKRKRTRETVGYRRIRTYTYLYHLDLYGRRLQVCKKFFVNTMDVKTNVIQRIFAKANIEPDEKPKSPKPTRRYIKRKKNQE